MKNTNIERVRLKAISWVKLPIKFDETNSVGNLFHPVFENKITYHPEKETLVDLSNKSDYDSLCNLKIQYIQQETNVSEILYSIRDIYRPDFFKYIIEDLSKEDFSVILKQIWISSETPNIDDNIPLNTYLSWFKKADKKYIMSPTEYEFYQQMPDTVQLYRGVGLMSNPDGISWTLDWETADWFANRFGQGYIIQGTASKKDILAYLDDRGEAECIISPKHIQNKEIQKG